MRALLAPTAAVGLKQDSVPMKIKELLLAAGERPNVDSFRDINAHTFWGFGAICFLPYPVTHPVGLRAA
jgi:hypothetical protein